MAIDVLDCGARGRPGSHPDGALATHTPAPTPAALRRTHGLAGQALEWRARAQASGNDTGIAVCVVLRFLDNLGASPGAAFAEPRCRRRWPVRHRGGRWRGHGSDGRALR